MRIVRAAVPLVLLASVRAAGRASDIPCPVVKTEVLPPCDAPAARPALATVDGAKVTASDLDETLRRRIDGLDAAVAEARLVQWASKAGLDVDRFSRDLEAGGDAADVLLERREGERIGVQGTPMLFVNGVFAGWEAHDVAGIRAAVDAALAKAAPARPAKAAAR